MEFLIALVIVFVGICAWINHYGDEAPTDDDYFSRNSRYSYEEDDNDGFRHHSHDDNDDSDNDDDDSDDDSDGDSGGDDD